MPQNSVYSGLSWAIGAVILLFIIWKIGFWGLIFGIIMFVAGYIARGS